MKFLSKDPVSHDDRAGKGRRPQLSSQAAPEELNAFLGQGCKFQGKLTYEGTVRIDARFVGEIFSSGTLVIGEDADIEAEIRVDNVIVSGKVVGNIHAKERLEMRRPARVIGNIISPCLVIEEGVLFEGNCRMGLLPTEQTSNVQLIGENEAVPLSLESLGERNRDGVA